MNASTDKRVKWTYPGLTRRSAISTVLTGIAFLAVGISLLPLVSIIVVLIRNGGQRLSWSLFTQLPSEGGIGNAFVGTMVMVGLASLLVVPLGILAAVYLAEFDRDSLASKIIRFSTRVLSGIPSILTGVFAYSLIVLATKTFSAVAGAVALALLMIPTVVLTAEQSLLAVPEKLRFAAYGLGATKAQVVLRVVIPTAWPAMLTGVLLAVARAAGETAPLLFTALSSQYWIESTLWTASPENWKSALMQPTASMSVAIYNFSTDLDPVKRELAWTAALVLVFAVLLVNIVGRLWSARKPR